MYVNDIALTFNDFQLNTDKTGEYSKVSSCILTGHQNVIAKKLLKKTMSTPEIMLKPVEYLLHIKYMIKTTVYSRNASNFIFELIILHIF